MKLVKNFVFAMVLVSAMAVNTPAGEQDVPGYVPPSPPRATSTCDEFPPVTDSDSEQIGNSAGTSDYLFYEALAALLSLY